MQVGERVGGDERRRRRRRAGSCRRPGTSTAGSGPRAANSDDAATAAAHARPTSRRRAMIDSERQKRPRPADARGTRTRKRRRRASVADDVERGRRRRSAGAALEARVPHERRRAHRRAAPRGLAARRLLRDEVDDQRHALEPVLLAQPVLEVVGPVAGDQAAVVDLDRDPRRRASRPGPRSRGAGACRASLRRRVRGDDVGDEAVELRGRDPLGAPVGELDRGRRAASARPRPLSAEQVITGGRWRTRLRDPRLRVLQVEASSSSLEVPLVERDQRRAAGLHRQLGDPQVLGGDPLGGVADDDRDVGALGRALGAELGVVVDRPGDLASAGGARRCRPGRTSRPSTSSSVSIASRVVPAQLGDDHPLGAQEGVDQRRLADVRPPDHREPRPASSLLGRGGSSGRRRASSTSRSSRSPVPRPWVAETGDRLAEAERVELGGQRLVAGAVDLVGDDDHRAGRRGAGSRRPRRRPGAARRARRARARPRRRRRSPSRAWSWTARESESVGLEVDAAGVDQLEPRPRSTRTRAPCGRGSPRPRGGRRPRGRRRAG